MVFNCNTYRAPFPESVRVHRSLYASQVHASGGFALCTYRLPGDGFIYPREYCTGDTVEGLAANLFKLKTRTGNPLEIVLAEPRDDFEREYYPTVAVEGTRKMLYVGQPDACINFAQPAVCATEYAANLRKKEMPCMTADEQAKFLALLLPKAKVRERH
ncbi:TPA: hypothetical protein HA251_05365 [Candidatus Woesearchaeota archaeon]|nr:hypothetical protein [Candidatus Woesearchaeota archaeon]